ncbi:hypothetical protein MC885_008360 [Smutsia gigantea]|nr:hypothetical protein MC885_008360 [Smutsia gigantea]
MRAQRFLRSAGGHNASAPRRALIWCRSRPRTPSLSCSPVFRSRLAPVPTKSPNILTRGCGACRPCFLGFQLPVSVSKSALSQLSRFQPALGPLPFLPLLPLLCLNLTPVAPKTAFVPKLLHQI